MAQESIISSWIRYSIAISNASFIHFIFLSNDYSARCFAKSIPCSLATSCLIISSDNSLVYGIYISISVGLRPFFKNLRYNSFSSSFVSEPKTIWLPERTTESLYRLLLTKKVLIRAHIVSSLTQNIQLYLQIYVNFHNKFID